jgi:hypothetical protein
VTHPGLHHTGHEGRKDTKGGRTQREEGHKARKDRERRYRAKRTYCLSVLLFLLFTRRITPSSHPCICCSPYAHNFVLQTGIPICKRTRVYAKNHVEYYKKMLNWCIRGSPYAYGQGRGVHAAESLKKLHMGIPVCIMKLCAYGEQHIHQQSTYYFNIIYANTITSWHSASTLIHNTLS